MVIAPVVVTGSISLVAICGAFVFDALKNWTRNDSAAGK